MGDEWRKASEVLRMLADEIEAQTPDPIRATDPNLLLPIKDFYIKIWDASGSEIEARMEHKGEEA